MKTKTLTTLFLLACIGIFGQNKTEYPLYACYFERTYLFSEADLKRMATSFDFVYGNEFSSDEIKIAKAANPSFQFIKYIGNWADNAAYFEDGHLRDMLYYPAALLAQNIDSATTSFKLGEYALLKGVFLKASTIEGDKSTNSFEYITWLRIDNELMRIEKWDSITKIVSVTRDFDKKGKRNHLSGVPVLIPAYSSEPEIKKTANDRPGRLGYHYDPAPLTRWENIYVKLVDYVKKGGDGVWIDILMDGSLRELDINGMDLPFINADGEPRMLALWNFEKNRPYFRDEFRKKCEAGVHYIQEKYKSSFGKYPIIFGNNMMASRFEEGNGGHKYYLYPTAEKPRPLDGMCIEDFMGGYHRDQYATWDKKSVLVPSKACYNCFSNYRNWTENVIELLKCSQDKLAAMPIIINAGIKTTAFPTISDSVRHDWELWAYASYLLGVDKQKNLCCTKLGIPMFHINNGTKLVALDSIYYLRIGDPVNSIVNANLDNLRIPNTSVYARKFKKGLVLVNPSDTAYEIKLDNIMFDPETKKKIDKIIVKPRTGRILVL